MKANTRKILLLLYTKAAADPDRPDEKISLNTAQLRWLLPDLSVAGFKSLLFYLTENQYLLKHELNNHSYYSLSNYGEKQLEEQFPALYIAHKDWNGKWTMIVFLQAIKTDQNFRYLRIFLLKHGCLALKRAVFLFPGQLSEVISVELNSRYSRAVMVYSLEDCIVGDERLIIGHKIALNDVLKIYSGISKELGELIDFVGNTKKLKDQRKQQFLSIYNRFESFLAQDSGLTKHFFPQVDGPLQILSKLQKLVKI
jgi:DNA-binding transcriptional regulator PaaX